MFPEITRDDVFRLETRRLWLRWPMAGDAEAVAAIACHKAVAEMTAHVPHPYPKGEAARRIDRWRAKNASGFGLKLIITRQGAQREPVGVVGLEPLASAARLGLLLAPERWGDGLATESVQAMIDAAFTYSDVPNVEASARVINPAARRVLERCGFAYGGTVLQDAPARGGMLSFDCFRLDRKAWASLKQWRMPIARPLTARRPAPVGSRADGSEQPRPADPFF